MVCKPLDFDPMDWDVMDVDFEDAAIADWESAYTDCAPTEWEEMQRNQYRFLRVTGLPRNCPWCYSAAELEKQLNEHLRGLTLEKIYIDFSDFRRAECYRRESLELSCIGGCVLLMFDKLAVMLFLDIEGMVRCCTVSPDQLRFEEFYGSEPECLSKDEYIVEVKDCFAAEYTGQLVTKVEVPGTDIWGMHLKAFDVERAGKAADANALPDGVYLYLETGTKVQLVCDESEYCYIVVKQ